MSSFITYANWAEWAFCLSGTSVEEPEDRLWNEMIFLTKRLTNNEDRVKFSSIIFSTCPKQTVPAFLIYSKNAEAQSTYFTVRGQSYFSRLPRYWPPIPSPPGESVLPPHGGGEGGTHSPGGEGDGGSIFWKTRDLGLPSHSKICTLCAEG